MKAQIFFIGILLLFLIFNEYASLECIRIYRKAIRKIPLKIQLVSERNREISVKKIYSAEFLHDSFVQSSVFQKSLTCYDNLESISIWRDKLLIGTQGGIISGTPENWKQNSPESSYLGAIKKIFYTENQTILFYHRPIVGIVENGQLNVFSFENKGLADCKRINGELLFLFSDGSLALLNFQGKWTEITSQEKSEAQYQCLYLWNNQIVAGSFDRGIRILKENSWIIPEIETGKIPANINCLIDDGKNLLAGSLDGLYQINPSGNNVQKISSLSVNCFFSEGDHIWIGTCYQGLWKLNIQNNQLTCEYPQLKEDIIEDLILFQGQIWVITSKKLFKIEGQLKNVKIPESSLHSNFITCLEEYHGNIISGSFQSGVGILDLQTRKLLRVFQYGGSPLPSDEINCMNKWRNQVFIGTSRGLCYFDGDLVINTELKKLSGISVLSLFSTDKKLWIGTNRGLFSLENGRIQREKNLSGKLLNNHLYCIAGNSEKIAIGSLGGINLISEEGVQDFHSGNSGLLNNWVNAIAFREENLYAGTYGKGIFQLSSGNSIQLPLLDKKETFEINPNAVLMDNQRVMFGTLKHGVTIIEQDNQVTFLTRKDGLLDENVFSFLKVNDSILVGTEFGISVMNYIKEK